MRNAAARTRRGIVSRHSITILSSVGGGPIDRLADALRARGTPTHLVSEMSADEWRVVSFISPKNSIQQIARATKKNDMEIRRIVYALLQAGLVELIRPAGAPPLPIMQRQVAQQGKKEEQKSLINRIIRRIRSL